MARTRRLNHPHQVAIPSDARRDWRGSSRGDTYQSALVLLLVVGLLSTAGVPAVRAGDDKVVGQPSTATTLRYQLNKGDRFGYVVEKRIETTFPDSATERATTTTQTFDVTWRVTGADSHGNARLSLTIDRVRYEGEYGIPGRFEFDSRTDKNPRGVPAIARVLTGVLKSLVGAEFTCSLSQRGEVGDFQVPKKVADAVKRTPGMKASYSTESFRQQLVDQTGVVLPQDPVSQGTGWNAKSDMAVAGGHARLTYYTKATYQGEAERGEKALAEIALQPTATGVQRAPGSGLGQFALKGHSGGGRILFDRARGRLVEVEVSQDVDMESSPPGQMNKVLWKVKFSLSSKLVPADSTSGYSRPKGGPPRATK